MKVFQDSTVGPALGQAQISSAGGESCPLALPGTRPTTAGTPRQPHHQDKSGKQIPRCPSRPESSPQRWGYRRPRPGRGHPEPTGQELLIKAVGGRGGNKEAERPSSHKGTGQSRRPPSQEALAALLYQTRLAEPRARPPGPPQTPCRPRRHARPPESIAIRPGGPPRALTARPGTRPPGRGSFRPPHVGSHQRLGYRWPSATCSLGPTTKRPLGGGACRLGRPRPNPPRHATADCGGRAHHRTHGRYSRARPRPTGPDHR